MRLFTPSFLGTSRSETEPDTDLRSLDAGDGRAPREQHPAGEVARRPGLVQRHRPGAPHLHTAGVDQVLRVLQR